MQTMEAERVSQNDLASANCMRDEQGRCSIEREARHG